MNMIDHAHIWSKLRPFCLLLDFEKGFDKLNWTFLDKLKDFNYSILALDYRYGIR